MRKLEVDKARGARLFAVNETAADEGCFPNKFNLLPFSFHHNLANDSRFEMDCIRTLALRLPHKFSFSGDVGVAKGWTQTGARSSSFEHALDKLAEGGSWIILKKVHEDAQYGPLLSQCLSEVEELVDRHLEPMIESRTMSLILSSPGQSTPYHIDGDCNFLFQIRGTKAFYVFDGRDSSVLSQMEEENFWAGDISAAKYREENQQKAWSFQMEPGTGVHVPVIFPHWVKNDQAISMSLSINFRFLGYMRADVHRANHFIRKLGLNPRPVGKSKLIDSVKGRALFGARMFAHKLRKLRTRAS